MQTPADSVAASCIDHVMQDRWSAGEFNLDGARCPSTTLGIVLKLVCNAHCLFASFRY
jgi:hypothetical protein